MAFTIRRSGINGLLLACIVLSPALQEVYSMLWSETIFLLLLLLFTIAIKKYLERPGMKWLIISAVLVSLACVNTVCGIVLVGIGLFLIFFEGKLSWGKRIQHCICFGVHFRFAAAGQSDPE